MHRFKHIGLLLGAVLLWACGSAERPPADVNLSFRPVKGAFDPGPGFVTRQGAFTTSRESPFVTGIATADHSGAPVRLVRIEILCHTREAETAEGELRLQVVIANGDQAHRVFEAKAGRVLVEGENRSHIVFEAVLVEDKFGNAFQISGHATWGDNPEPLSN